MLEFIFKRKKSKMTKFLMNLELITNILLIHIKHIDESPTKAQRALKHSSDDDDNEKNSSKEVDKKSKSIINKKHKKISKFKPTIKPCNDSFCSIPDDDTKISSNKEQKKLSQNKISNKKDVEKEEDIFLCENQQIFRFLSVSFIENFHKEIIGRGATSEVFKVTNVKYPNKVFALKRIYLELIKVEDEDNNNNDDDDDEGFRIDVAKMKRFFQEFEVMKHFNHKNIIKTYGFCTGDKTHSPSILLEYCPYNLKKMIKKLTDEERSRIIIEVSESMKKIHENGIIHRDLKPENILLDINKEVKVSDFGICTFINQSETSSSSRTQLAGTLQFMAPEIINRCKKYDEKVDVYSFGVVYYFILTKGKLPDISLVEVGTGKQAQLPNSFTKISHDIIKKCWSFDPKERPSFIEICEIVNNNKQKLI